METSHPYSRDVFYRKYRNKVKALSRSEFCAYLDRLRPEDYTDALFFDCAFVVESERIATIRRMNGGAL